MLNLLYIAAQQSESMYPAAQQTFVNNSGIRFSCHSTRFLFDRGNNCVE